MLHAAVIPVHPVPVIKSLLRGKGLVIVGVHISEEVPGGACPLGHSVRLSLSLSAAFRAGSFNPVSHLGKRCLAVIRRLVGLHLRQEQGQLLLRQGYKAAAGALNYRYGLTPITLTGKDPVPELIVYLFLARPLSVSHCVILSFASSTGSPFKKPELTIVPVSQSVKASFSISRP